MNKCCKRFCIKFYRVVSIFLPTIIVLGIIIALLFGIKNISMMYVLEPNLNDYLTYTEYQNLMRLMSKGVVLSADDIIANIVSYYNFILTLVLSLFGIVTVFGFIYNTKKIEQEANDKIKEIAEKYLKNYITSKSFYDLVVENIDKVTTQKVGEAIDYSSISDILETLNEYKDYTNTRLEEIDNENKKLKEIIKTYEPHTIEGKK